MSGCCGPIGSRFNQLKTTIDMLAGGHLVVAESLEAIAKDLVDENDKKTTLEVAQFHRDVAANTQKNIIIFEDDDNAG